MQLRPWHASGDKGVAAAPRGGGSVRCGRDVPFYDVSMRQNRVVPGFFLLSAAAVALFLTAHVMKPRPGAQAPQAKQAFESVEQLPVVTLANNGELFLNGSPVRVHTLGEELQRRFPRAKAVYVRADSRSHWVPVAQILRVLGERGLDVRVAAQPANAGG